MNTPRQLLADWLRPQLDRRRWRLVDAPAGLDQLEAGRHGVVLALAAITPTPARTGARSYETDLWVVSPHADILRAAAGLETAVEQLLQLIDQAPFEAVWTSCNYDQFGDGLYHAYRITITTPLEVIYPTT